MKKIFYFSLAALEIAEAFCIPIKICGFIENIGEPKDKPPLIWLDALEIICSLISLIPGYEVFRIAATLISIFKEVYLMKL